MTLHAASLAVLASWSPPDAAQAAERDAYVAHLRAHSDGLLRECAPDHLTASAVVLDAHGEHTLLTLHRKARRWFQLGGHCEPGDASVVEAAAREAREESGLPASALHVDPVPLQLSPHDVPFCRPPALADHPGAVVRHLDVRFLVVADRSVATEVSDESLDVRWWPVDALPDPEPALREAVGWAVERVQSTRSTGSAASSSPGGGSTAAAADQPSR